MRMYRCKRYNCNAMGAIRMHCAHECWNHSITKCLPRTFHGCSACVMYSVHSKISGRNGAVIRRSLFFSARAYHGNSLAAVWATYHKQWELLQIGNGPAKCKLTGRTKMYRHTGTTGIVVCEQASISASAQATAYTSQSPTDSAHEPLWGLPSPNPFVTEFLKSHCVYRLPSI